MVTCEYCGKQAEASLGTCPSCGAPLPAEVVEETNTVSADETETASSGTGSTVAAVLGVLTAAEMARHKPPLHPVSESPHRERDRRDPQRPVSQNRMKEAKGPAGHRPPGGPGGLPGPR